MVLAIIKLAEFLGGVAGIVAGATIGGLLASNLNFSSTLGNVVGASLVFLAVWHQFQICIYVCCRLF